MAKKGSFSKVYDKNGDYADVEAVRFDGTRTFQMQGDVTASQTWNGDPSSPLTLNASIGAKKVTQDKIADKAVGTGQMADGSVGLTQMAASAMTDTVSANNAKLVTSQGVNAAIAAATLNRGKDYGPLSVDEINAISETIPTGSTVYVESLGASDAKVINDGYSDGTMASFSVEVGEDLKYYRSPDNSLHGWYSTEANVKIKQPANYAGGIAVDSAQDASSGSAGIEFIQSFKQNTNGDIRDIVKAQVDIVDSVSSTRTNAAATPNSVKSAYDLANTANTGLANKLDKTGDGKDVTVSFSEASTRANIGTGEKLSVMFGKIKKWFTDLKALAFKDTVSDSDISGTISDNHIASASTWNGKADKVSGATNGNFAALDSNGNLTDSGSKASDFATSEQGSKADSAIQGVKVNNTTLTPDANKVVTVPLATTSADGAMSAADKTKLDGIAAGAEANVQSDWDETNSSSDAFIKNKPHFRKYVSSLTKYKVCTFKGANHISGLQFLMRKNEGTLSGELIIRNENNVLMYTKTCGDVSSINSSVTLYAVKVGSDVEIYAEGKQYSTLVVAPTANIPKEYIDFTNFGTVVDSLPEGYAEIASVKIANSASSSGTAPVKVDAYGALTPVPMDSTPTASSPNLMTSGDIKTALDGKQDALPTSGTASSTYAINISGTAGAALKIDNRIGSAPVEDGGKTYQLIARFVTNAWTRFSLKLMIGGETGRACSILFITIERNTQTPGLPTIAASIVGNRAIAGAAQYGLEYTFDSTNNNLYLYGVTYAGMPMYPILLDDTSKSPAFMVLYSITDTITAPSNTTSLTIEAHVRAPLDTQVGDSATPVYVGANGQVQACTDTFVNNIAYVANQSGGGGNLNKTINGTTTSVLTFMNDSEAVAIWADAKTAAANAS